MNVVKEMINIRDGYKKCDGFYGNMIKSIIDDISIWMYRLNIALYNVILPFKHV